jgi:hypothetical protein
MEIKERKELKLISCWPPRKIRRQEAKWVRELFELQAEDAKERLVNAEGIDVPRIQGEARVMDRITKQLTAATALLSSQS